MFTMIHLILIYVCLISNGLTVVVPGVCYGSTVLITLRALWGAVGSSWECSGDHIEGAMGGPCERCAVPW